MILRVYKNAYRQRKTASTTDPFIWLFTPKGTLRHVDMRNLTRAGLINVAVVLKEGSPSDTATACELIQSEPAGIDEMVSWDGEISLEAGTIIRGQSYGGQIGDDIALKCVIEED